MRKRRYKTRVQGDLISSRIHQISRSASLKFTWRTKISSNRRGSNPLKTLDLPPGEPFVTIPAMVLVDQPADNKEVTKVQGQPGSIENIQTADSVRLMGNQTS